MRVWIPLTLCTALALAAGCPGRPATNPLAAARAEVHHEAAARLVGGLALPGALQALARGGATLSGSARLVGQDGQLTRSGALVRDALAAAGRDHDLDPRRYHQGRVDRLAYTLVDLARSDPLARELRLTRGERAKVAAAAREIVRQATQREARQRLLRRLVARDGPAPRIAGLYLRGLAHRRRVVEAATRLERILVEGLARLARDLGFRGAVARELSSIRDARGMRKLLDRLPPPHPQYRRLFEPLRRYRRVVAAGGWQRVPHLRGLRPGRRHRVVLQLKRRLAAEGYFDGEIDRRYDEALTEAVRAYQRTHQMAVSGRPHRWFWRSLDVSADRRLQTIELAIRRWRRSQAGRGEPCFMRVNIPDFHLEVWRDGKRLLRQRVVVGKSHPYKCDEETQREVLAFATPEQTARIKTLVFSPYWNVTKDIKETELEPERGKDPLFYEKHGYEIMQPGTKGEWVRELPGPANSLGFVKFLFPSPHETYLHDTPIKSLFRRTIRAYSHGCVRVEDAWTLAKTLLTHDGQWQEEHYRTLHRRWLAMDFLPLQTSWDEELYDELKERAQRLETHVKLRRPVQIHVEYVTVRVDDRGEVHFLSDIYRLDEQALEGARERRCVPESKLARQAFDKTISRVESLERQVVALAPCVVLARSLRRSLAARPGVLPTDRRLKRLDELGKYTQRHAGLARYIRDQHEALEEALEASKRRWRKALTRRAVRLRRLLTALETMTRKSEQICTKVVKVIEQPRRGP